MSSLDFRGDWSRVLWSDRSPEEGDPTCLCSYCGIMIPAGTVCLRLFSRDRTPTLEARFCDPCADTCFGIKSFPAEEDVYERVPPGAAATTCPACGWTYGTHKPGCPADGA